MLHASLWVVVGSHLFGLLALLWLCIFPKTQFGSAFGSRERRAIMGYRDMRIYYLWTCIHSSVSRHSVTGAPQYTTKYANYANYSVLNELACPQPGVRRFFAALITSLTSHFLHCPKLTHTLEKLLISPSP